MRVCVYRAAWMPAEELAELIALLEGLGFEVVIIEAFADQVIAADVVFTAVDKVVILLSPGCDGSTQLQGLSERVSRAGGRVVGVWPRGTKGEEGVASPLEWHGSAVVPWNVQRICDALAGEDVWEMPDGAKRVAPHTDRHTC